MKNILSFLLALVSVSVYAQDTNPPPIYYSFVYALPAQPPVPTNLYSPSYYVQDTNQNNPTIDFPLPSTNWVWFYQTNWDTYNSSSNTQFFAQQWFNSQSNPSHDARYTNSPLWTAAFISGAQNYRSIIRAYQGVGSETNAVVTPQTISTFLGQNPAFVATPSNVVNMLSEALFAPSLLQWGDATTAKFPWRLIP